MGLHAPVELANPAAPRRPSPSDCVRYLWLLLPSRAMPCSNMVPNLVNQSSSPHTLARHDSLQREGCPAGEIFSHVTWVEGELHLQLAEYFVCCI